MPQQKITIRPTNITELLGRERLTAALYQCGKPMEAASDYELFSAFCALQPLLIGHALRLDCLQLLATLEIALPPNTGNCDVIWHRVADQLLCGDCKPAATPTITDDTQSLLQALPPPCELSCKSAQPLLRTKAGSWAAWSVEIESFFQRFLQDKTPYLFYKLPQDYVDSAPNLYAVEAALSAKARNHRQRAILHAQLLRRIAEFCKSHDRSLLLSVAGSAASLERLLTRLQFENRLPTLLILPGKPATARLAIQLSEKNSTLQIVLDQQQNLYFKCETDEVMYYAKRYPLGRLIQSKRYN